MRAPEGEVDTALANSLPTLGAPLREQIRTLLRLAVPLALAQAGQSLMGLVDTAVLGRLTPEAQGAAGLANSLSFTVMLFGMGVMMALEPLVAQAVGAGQRTAARALLWQGFWLALLASAVLCPLVVLLPGALAHFGVAPSVAQQAGLYAWWRVPGVPGTLLFVVARAYLQATGRQTAIFGAMVAANLLNLALDVLLVFGIGPIPALGVRGAALATSLSTWAQFVIMALALDPAPAGLLRAPDWAALRSALRLGLPIGAHFLVESGVFALAGVLAGRLGAQSVAAHQVALNWASFTFCIAAGVGSAASVQVGWAVGARTSSAVRRTGMLAFACAAAVMSCACAAFFLFPEPLARLLSSDPVVIRMVSSLFFVAGCFQVFDGIQVVGAGALRGAGDTGFPFWANLVGHWLVGLPVALALGVWGPFGLAGIWWGLSAGLAYVAVAVFVRFVRVSGRPVASLLS